jgi:hypothetical protein
MVFKFLRGFKKSSKPRSKPKKPVQKKGKEGNGKGKALSLVENECIVCLEQEPCLTTTKCNHPICVTCLGTYINVTHHSRMPCPCPSSAICEQEFTIDDLTPYLDDEQVAKIWLVQANIQIEKGHGIYCPNPRCSKPVLWNSAKTMVEGKAGKCRACQQAICMSCKSGYHTGLTYHILMTWLR